MPESYNNSIFEEKHYYMKLLDHIENLEKEITPLVQNQCCVQNQLNEISEMKYNALAGLFRNNVPHEIIKETEIVRFTLNNAKYDIPISTLREKLESELEKYPELKTEIENIANSHNQNSNSAAKQNFTQNKYDQSLEKNKFIFDIVNIEMFQPGAQLGEKMTFFIFPVHLAKKDYHPDIIVLIKSDIDDKYQICTSGETSTILTKFSGFEFLIRGTFKNNIFESYIIPAGQTEVNGCKMDLHKTEYRSKESTYGHIYFEKGNAFIHAIPLCEENGDDGMAKFLLCIENGEIQSGENKYTAVANMYSSNINVILPDQKTTSFIGYWVGDSFSVDNI